MPANVLSVLTRKKTLTDESVEKSELKRCLNILDLTLLGVGSTLGLGVYVLAGSVAKSVAGPAVTISFLVAAVASAFAGICYAEFAARVPRAGSAYVYSYVCVGEFVAFVIGWNLILEYVIGTASVARGLSSYTDTLIGNVMQNKMKELMPIDIDFLSTYPDLFAFAVIMVLAGVLSSGVKESTILNNIFTVVNLITVSIVIIAGSLKSDVHNWKIPKSEIPAAVASVAGEGGFMPFGLSGVMAGAAKCFYGFVGFDCVATTGEEAKNPQKSIPIAIVISLIIIFFSYFGISTVLTMMLPYYDQDEHAPLPHVFTKVGWTAVMWIVTIGAVFALCTSLLGAMFPLPRILYAMANDGLLFQSLANIHPRTKTPLLATLLSGLLAGIMATIFDLNQLIDMMSIGTLLAYTIVAVCVLVLRYEDPSPSSFEYASGGQGIQFGNSSVIGSVLHLMKLLFNLSMIKYPSVLSSSITKWSIILFSVFTVGFCAMVIFAGTYLEDLSPWSVVLAVIFLFLMLLTLMIIGRQPTSNVKLSFKVPLVPAVPALSIFVNLYLMLALDVYTWIRFGVWLAVGFLIYVFYGLKNSKERNLSNGKGESRQLDTHQEGLVHQSQADTVQAKYNNEPSGRVPDIPENTKF